MATITLKPKNVVKEIQVQLNLKKEDSRVEALKKRLLGGRK